MAPGNGKTLLLGIEHLDAASDELIDRLDTRVSPSGVPAAGVNGSLVRLLGAELRWDPDAIDRAA